MSMSTPKCAQTRSLSSATKNRIVDLIDPRSPTTAFQRTPIQVVLDVSDGTDKNSSIPIISHETSSPVSFVSSSSNRDCTDKMQGGNETTSTNCSFVSANADSDLSISCVDLSSQDVSAIVSDMSACSLIPGKTSETVELLSALGERNELVNLRNIKLNPAEESCSYFDVVDDSVSETVPLIKKPMKKLFCTPNKKRSPLVAVDNVCPVTPTSALGSPKNVLREKQWKRIQEERKKLGFESDENFQLPLNDVTASAPSKLMLRRQNTQNQFNIS